MNDVKTKSVEAYASDVAFLESFGAHVLARAARLRNTHLTAESIHQAQRDVLGPKATTASKELERRAAILRDDDERVAREVQQRTEATRKGGKLLGIDELCREFGLNEIERTTLLLSTLVTLDQAFENGLSELTPRSFSGQITPDLIFAFLELSLAAVVTARAMLQPTAPLLRHGLVSLTLGSSATPYDFRGAYVLITDKAFSLIVGGDLAKDAVVGGVR